VDEQSLSGGRTFGAIKVADTIRKPRQPWTPAVHAVLEHLERAGFEGAPRARGYDESGRAVYSYLDGEVVGDQWPWPDWAYAEETLVQAGAWLRRLHRATADFVPPADAIWFSGRPWQPGLVIGHNDNGPYNAVWRDGALVGFVDWDTAGPAPPGFDLAYLALSWAPLLTERLAEEKGFVGSFDRHRRLHLILDGYGFDGDPADLREAVVRRSTVHAEVIRQLAADGNPIFVAMLPSAENYERTAREVADLPPDFWRRPAGPVR
jgi:hypothetical protein